ncbi:MAG: phosphatidylglycerophosphatase A [Acidobacteria bacterium]|nr:phosphatidylglycerophosphatase A [Acidobacteriota bacterium]
MDKLAFNIATTFGLGDRLPAPGTTAGSLPASLIWLFVAWGLLNSPWLAVATTTMITVAVIVGFWASAAEITRRGNSDPGPVVIDEVAGQWLTYGCALPLWAAATHLEMVVFTGAGFLLFRFFDILKPWPIRRLERLHGALGVMADDLLAGLFAGIVLALIRPYLAFLIM